MLHLADVAVHALALDHLFFAALLEEAQRLVLSADVVVGRGSLENTAVGHVEAPTGRHCPATLGADLGPAVDLVLREHVVDRSADLGESGRVDRFGFAENMLYKVGVVHVQIEQAAAGDFAVEVRALAPRRRLGDSLEVRTEYFAVAATGNGFLQPGPLRPEPKAHGGHEKPLGIRRGIGDLAGVVERAGEWFFAEDMLAGGQRGLG